MRRETCVCVFVVVDNGNAHAGSNGNVFAFGYNGYGQLGVGDNTNRNTPTQIGLCLSGVSVVGVAAGYWHSLVVGKKTKGRDVFDVLLLLTMAMPMQGRMELSWLSATTTTDTLVWVTTRTGTLQHRLD